MVKAEHFKRYKLNFKCSYSTTSIKDILEFVAVTTKFSVKSSVSLICHASIKKCRSYFCYMI